MRPYSMDLRERVAAAVDHGEGSLRQIARTFRVSLSFIVRLLQRRRDVGTLAPKPHGGGPPPALGPADLERLGALIAKDPDATLEQLRRRGRFRCSLKTLWYALRRLNLTRKKKRLHASERQRDDVQEKRRVFGKRVRRIAYNRLVFLDETGITTTMTPTYAWAPRGERAVDSVPASWQTMTVIAALGLEGVRAPLVFPGATNSTVFQAYVDQALVPALHPDDVVVLDNLRPHLTARVAASIQGAGARLLPLPPYSSDYTPIEDMWSKVKQILRGAKARTKRTLYNALGEALKQVTLQDIRGWFKKVRLCAIHG
jgi:transposase